MRHVIRETLAADVQEDVDDHGLVGWCFIGTGQNMPPFSALRQQQPDAWATCVAAFRQVEEN